MSGKRRLPPRHIANTRAWQLAIDQLQQRQNRDAVLALLAEGVPVPDWARKEIAQWRAGKRPKQPRGPAVWELQVLAAADAVRDPANKRKGESRDQRIERVARDLAVRLKALRAFLGCRGGTYRALVKDWEEWERIYCDDAFALGPDKQ